jgi:hypothetical protein
VPSSPDRTPPVKETRVQCPRCDASYDPSQLLAGCTVSWPNQKWLLFRCPGCKADAHVEVANGRLAIGELDGGPGPCFFPRQTLTLPGLKVAATAGGVSVVFKGKRTRVPAKT